MTSDVPLEMPNDNDCECDAALDDPVRCRIALLIRFPAHHYNHVRHF